MTAQTTAHRLRTDADQDMRAWLDATLDRVGQLATGDPWRLRYTVGSWFVVPAPEGAPVDYDHVATMQSTGPRRRDARRNAEVTVIGRNLLPRTVATVRAILRACDAWVHENPLCGGPCHECVCQVADRRRRLIRTVAALFDAEPGYDETWRP